MTKHFIKYLIILVLFPISIWSQKSGVWLSAGSLSGDQADDLYGVHDLSEDGSIMVSGLSYYDQTTDDYIYRIKVHQHDGKYSNNWIQLGDMITGEDGLVNSVDLNADGSIMSLSPVKTYGFGKNWPVNVYQYNGSQWEKLGNTIINPTEYGYISAKLSSDGKRLVVGMSNINNPIDGYDYLRIFNFDGVKWEQSDSDIPLESKGDRISNINISLDGNSIAFKGENASKEYIAVYAYNGNSWIQKGQIINRLDIETAPDKKLHHLRMSGDGSTIALSTWVPYMDAEGDVYVFSYKDNTTWHNIGVLPVYSGSNLSISSNGTKILASSGLAYSHYSGNSNGEATVFKYNPAASVWNQEFYFQPDQWWMYYGYTSVISGNGNRMGIAMVPDGVPGNIVTYSYFDYIEAKSVHITTKNNDDSYIYANETLQLEASVLPQEVSQEVIWGISSGENIISLDNNGLVT